jgi:hypothetical protein
MMDRLFFCYGGSNGDIGKAKDCGNNRCNDAGTGKSDSCVARLRFGLVNQYVST